MKRYDNRFKLLPNSRYLCGFSMTGSRADDKSLDRKCKEKIKLISVDVRRK